MITPYSFRLRNATDVSLLVQRLVAKIQARRPDIAKHTDYFYGKRGKLEFASEEFQMYMSDRFSNFSDNWCAPVAQAPVERIKFQGFVNMNGLDMPSGVMRRWERNDASRGLSEAALMMTTARRSFGLVTQTPNGKARITFEHPDSCAIVYDKYTGEPAAGLVLQEDDFGQIGTLLLPDKIYTVFHSNDFVINDNPEAKRIPPSAQGWTFDPSSEQPNPLGEIPLREFRNQKLLDDSPISDIELVESMQDTVNVIWAYLLNALDFASLPARVIMGGSRIEEEVYDADGNIVGYQPAQLDKQVFDRITQLTGDAKIGEWSASNLDAFLPVINKAVEHIAAETRTPGHYLLTSSEVPATGYETAEAGLVKKTEDRISYLRRGVLDLNRLAALTEGDLEAAQVLEDSVAAFAAPQYRSQAQMTDAMVKFRQIGFPLRWIAEQYGLSPDEVQRLMDMKAAEDEDPTMSKIAEQLEVNNADSINSLQPETGSTGSTGSESSEETVVEA